MLKGVLWLKISLKKKKLSFRPLTNDKERECKNIYSKRQNV